MMIFTEEKTDKAGGNGVVVLGCENLKRIPKLRRLIQYFNDQSFVNYTAQGQVVIQSRTENYNR